jgi:hypothetical protein
MRRTAAPIATLWAVRARRAALLMLVPLATVVGCGSDSKDSGSQASGSQDANGIASKPPRAILADAAAALRRAESFHLEGTQGAGKKATEVKADIGLPSKLRLTIGQGDASASIIIVGGSLYIKANAAFWNQQGVGQAAQQLAGRWLKTPAGSGELQSLTKDLDTKTLAGCLVKGHGTLEHGGKATVDGQEAVVIVDKGDRPGTNPGKLFVAATGEPLPLRTLATGPERPGGKQDPKCDDGTPTTAGDEATFSDYDEPLDLSAPSGAVEIGGGTTS